MSRFFAFAFGSVAVSCALIGWMGVGCSDSPPETTEETSDATAILPPRRDSSLVDPPPEAGPMVEAAAPVVTSCAKYCDLVTSNCTGEYAQYGSVAECIAFCAVLPLAEPKTEGGEEKAAASVACRQYWADSPAHTNPKAYCLAAGPFGGNVCGDRCTTFCDVVLATCSPDGGVPAYESQPECATACADFSYHDAGTDGGGEGPKGPKTGDTLNCRLFHLRAASMSAKECPALNPDGGICAW